MSLLELIKQIEAKQNGASTMEALSSSTPTPPSLLETVEAIRTPRVLDESVFLKFVSQHRKHQLKAINSTVNQTSGQIIIPTGTGKTRVQIHIHVQDMIEKTKSNQTGVYVIGAHRLLLCKQLMDELQGMCIECHIPFNALYVGSARIDDKAVYDEYFHQGIDASTYESTFTTRGEEVKSFYDRTSEAKRHLIIVSTYHSFDRLKVLDNIDLCTYDEAHTTIAGDFTENIKMVKDHIKRNFFFTATRKVQGEDNGMNDRKMYGEQLTYVSPKEMIDAGEIVMPCIHTIMLKGHKTKEISEDDEQMLVYTIQEAFIEHKKKLKEDSAYPEDLGTKLLVTIKGSTELKKIQNNALFKDWCRDNNIKTFAFSSMLGNIDNFVEEPNRNKVYGNMKSLSDKQDAILLHIDILIEGIDLPSITGVLLFRHLNEVKLFQAIGRALRLLRVDRERLYMGTMKPKETHLFTKPHAYLILPMHFEKMDESSKEMRTTLERVLSNYEIPTEEFLPEETFDGVSPCYLNPVTDAEAIDKNERLYPLSHVISDLDLTAYQKALPIDPLEAIKVLLADLKAVKGSEEDHMDEEEQPTTTNEELPLCSELQDTSKPTTNNAAPSFMTSSSETVLMLPFKGSSEQ